jgi:hypothetical protein
MSTQHPMPVGAVIFGLPADSQRRTSDEWLRSFGGCLMSQGTQMKRPSRITTTTSQNSIGVLSRHLIRWTRLREPR